MTRSFAIKKILIIVWENGWEIRNKGYQRTHGKKLENRNVLTNTLSMKVSLEWNKRIPKTLWIQTF